jgi:pyruvate dehydrogenase E2 component (dihydrolipoamide acetyltransferase)
MPIEIRMPQPAPDIDEVDLIDWLVEPGAEVALGEPIVEIETDKSTLEVEAPAAGILSEITVASGSLGVPVGAVIGLIEARAEESVPGSEPRPAAEPARPATPPPAAGPTTNPSESATVGAVPSPDSSDSGASAPPASRSTALARRLAERAGIEIDRVRGSGSHGRVTRADIEQKIPAPGAGPLEPYLRLEADCQASALLRILASIEENSGGTRIPLEAVILRAAALALRNAPEIAQASGGEVAASGDPPVDIALLNAGTPGDGRQIREADRKGLAILAAELEALDPEPETTDGSESDTSEFAVIHLDIPGVNRHWPVPRPGARVTVGTAPPRRQPVAQGESVGVGDVLTLTLCADTREIEAAAAARLLAAIRRFIEQPLEMAL